MLRALTVFCCLIGTPAVAADVYKCPDANGKVTYQQTPCESGSATGKMTIAPKTGAEFATPTDRSVASDPEARKAAVKSELNRHLAADRGKIMVGMSDKQVRRAWGDPQKINASLTKGGKHEQWVYGASQYVYLENGIVTSIQSSQ